jgi:hypothetical protein
MKLKKKLGRFSGCNEAQLKNGLKLLCCETTPGTYRCEVVEKHATKFSGRKPRRHP